MYLSWRHHPVTRLYGRLLAHLVTKFEGETLARWRAHALTTDVDREMCGRVRMLADMNPLEMPFASILEIFGPDHPETEEEDEPHGL
jgi:hypothetical protein